MQPTVVGDPCQYVRKGVSSYFQQYQHEACEQHPRKGDLHLWWQFEWIWYYTHWGPVSRSLCIGNQCVCMTVITVHLLVYRSNCPFAVSLKCTMSLFMSVIVENQSSCSSSQLQWNCTVVMTCALICCVHWNGIDANHSTLLVLHTFMATYRLGNWIFFYIFGRMCNHLYVQRSHVAMLHEAQQASAYFYKYSVDSSPVS